MKKITVASHLTMASLLLGALLLQLVPVAFAGLLVYTLTHRLSDLLSRPVSSPRLTKGAKLLALLLVTLGVFALFSVAILFSAQFVRGQDGLPWLLTHMADILEKVRISVPPSLQTYVPASVTEMQAMLVNLLRTHGDSVSKFGVEVFKSGALLILAMVAGAMVSWANFAEPQAYEPYAGALLQRCRHLAHAFEKVVFAQVLISAINTSLTALYLLVVLPAFGSHLPMAPTLVAITFVVGLLPVLGNLVSNSIIVTLSLGVSPQLGAASLGFLILIHKLEYFLNAKIIGHKIEASAWELILAMIAMERLFGVAGLVAAPILYAYIKRELRDAGLIGRRLVVEPRETGSVAPPLEEVNDASIVLGSGNSSLQAYFDSLKDAPFSPFFPTTSPADSPNASQTEGAAEHPSSSSNPPAPAIETPHAADAEPALDAEPPREDSAPSPEQSPARPVHPWERRRRP